MARQFRTVAPWASARSAGLVEQRPRAHREEPGDVPALMPEHLVRARDLGRRTGRGCRDDRR